MTAPFTSHTRRFADKTSPTLRRGLPHPCQLGDRQTTKNILGILQEVDNRLRDEMAAVEDISKLLQPIIRPLPARSRFTRRHHKAVHNPTEVQAGLSHSNHIHDELEQGDSTLIGESLRVRTLDGNRSDPRSMLTWQRKRSSHISIKEGEMTPQPLKDTENSSHDLRLWDNRPCENLRADLVEGYDPRSPRSICTLTSSDKHSTNDSSVKSPRDRRDHLRKSYHPRFQGHLDLDRLNSTNSREAPPVMQNSSETHTSACDMSWLIDAMHLLKEYYMKKAESKTDNSLVPSTVSLATATASGMAVSRTTSTKATQTSPVICEQIHTSPCGHFQWVATDRMIPDTTFYVSPFDVLDIPNLSPKDCHRDVN